jgi:hypothetical protein
MEVDTRSQACLPARHRLIGHGDAPLAVHADQVPQAPLELPGAHLSIGSGLQRVPSPRTILKRAHVVEELNTVDSGASILLDAQVVSIDPALLCG